MLTGLSDKLAAFLKPVAEIRQGERLKTIVMFFYFFLTISLIYILKPVRGALFLNELGAKNLRYVYMGEGLFLIFVAAAYVYLSRKLPKKLFFTLTLLFFASNLVIFWFLFRMKMPYLSAVFYIWVASFSITSTTQFWILANDIFDPAEAKRLFGLIISGGSAGGILGGVMTAQAMRFLHVEDMLWVAAAVLMFCILLISLFWEKIYKNKQVAEPVQQKKDDGSGRKLLLGSSYLIMLALLVVTAKMASTIIDNQFNRVVELTISGKEAKAAFFGSFMAWANVVSFLMQLFVTSFCLRFLGVGLSLWILPVGLTLFSTSTLFYPVLGSALFLKVFDGSINYSIQQASKEVLFLPIASQIRYRVKPVIDMLGFRLAKSMSGIYIALIAPLLGLADEKLGILVLFLMPLWIFLVFRMRRAYSVLLRSHVLTLKQTKSESKISLEELLRNFQNEAFLRNYQNDPVPQVRQIAAAGILSQRLASEDRQKIQQGLEKIVREDGLQPKMDAALGRAQIKDKIQMEIKMFRRLQKLQWSQEVSERNGEQYAHFIKASLDKSLEQIFCLLKMLYRQESFDEIYLGITQYPEGNAVRSHAVELLMNTLEPDLLPAMSGLFELRKETPSAIEISEIFKNLKESKVPGAVFWGDFLAYFILSQP